MAQPVWRESVSLDAAADADVHRGPGAAAHLWDGGNVHEIPAGDGFPDLAQHSSGPRGLACDAGYLRAHRCDFRDFAGAAVFERSAGGGVERGPGDAVGWTAEGAAGERAGGGEIFFVADAAVLRRIVDPQFHERAANQSGIQFT